jgi:lipoic acid synthetase
MAEPVKLPIAESRPRPARRLPTWLRKPLHVGGTLDETRRVVAASGVATVCQEARCPNLGECWSRRSATFMVMGDICTRRCHFCSVRTGRPEPLGDDEPRRLAEAVCTLRLRHVVVTAVSRDDLPDEGAGHLARCITAVRQTNAKVTVEVLPADLHARRELIAHVCRSGPHIYNHNIETTEVRSPLVRPQARYHRSLRALEIAKEIAPQMLTKSGLMVGLGETRDQLRQTFGDLRSVGVDVLTIGQYLQPGAGQAVVQRYYRPEEFDELAAEARSFGFVAVSAGPFVRSSYNADAVFTEARRRAGRSHACPS